MAGNNNGRITDCYAEADVFGNDRIGGLVGKNDGFRFPPEGGGQTALLQWGGIERCYASGNVAGDDKVGGLVGENSGTIINCRSNSIIGAEGDGSGGLVGENDGRVMACYSNSNVDGDVAVGGLVGRNYGAKINSAYSAVAVNIGHNSYEFGSLLGGNVRDGKVENATSLLQLMELRLIMALDCL